MQRGSMPTSIAQFRVDDILGQGGMGIVYLGHDTRLCRPVAIKVLLADRIDDGSRLRFREEALLLSRLNHPNIATVFDFGHDAGTDYFVMEFLPGETLAALLRTAPLPRQQVAVLGTQLARGLAAAHAAGVIHRDIKPNNLWVTPGGHLKILDFGVAVSPKCSSGSSTTGSGAHVLLSLAGTMQYMAPERLRGGPADGRTDIFSAGTVLYEMACGRPPYADEHPVRLIESILAGKPPRPSRIAPGVDRTLERVILRALQPDPVRRYEDASQLAADLEKIARRRNPAVRARRREAPEPRTLQPAP